VLGDVVDENALDDLLHRHVGHARQQHAAPVELGIGQSPHLVAALATPF
jgi:hypothetical protein